MHTTFVCHYTHPEEKVSGRVYLSVPTSFPTFWMTRFNYQPLLPTHLLPVIKADNSNKLMTLHSIHDY